MGPQAKAIQMENSEQSYGEFPLLKELLMLVEAKNSQPGLIQYWIHCSFMFFIWLFICLFIYIYLFTYLPCFCFICFLLALLIYTVLILLFYIGFYCF